MQKLLLKSQLKQLPKIGEQSQESDPIAYAKLFTPWTYWTWYLLEYDPETNIAFCYVEGHEDEYGDVSLDELREIRGPAGLYIERDRHFEPKRLSQVKKQKQKVW